MMDRFSQHQLLGAIMELQTSWQKLISPGFYCRNMESSWKQKLRMSLWLFIISWKYCLVMNYKSWQLFDFIRHKQQVRYPSASNNGSTLLNVQFFVFPNIDFIILPVCIPQNSSFDCFSCFIVEYNSLFTEPFKLLSYWSYRPIIPSMFPATTFSLCQSQQ